jgi:RES domain-containing protein
VAYPSPPARFDPLLETWPAGLTLWRSHALRRPPLEPNPTVSAGRFRPVRTAAGAVVATIYAGDSTDAAIAEGPFHNLAVKAGPKQLARAIVDGMALTPLEPTRELRLVTLRGHGMRRVGQRQKTLIEPGPRIYAASAPWGQAAYDDLEQPDGMTWVSRQFPDGTAFLLFWDRCGGEIVQMGPTFPLAFGRGLDLLHAAANAADVVIYEG